MTYELALIAYIVSVCSLGLYALNKTTRLFSKIKRRRLKWSLETIATESAPFEEEELKAKQRAQGVEAIESQFTVSQPLTIPLISLMILIAMGIQEMNRVVSKLRVEQGSRRMGSTFIPLKQVMEMTDELFS